MSAVVGRMPERWADARAYSWASMLHAVEHGTLHARWTSPSSERDKDDDNRWYGGLVLKQAIDLAHGRGDVWPEGRATIEQIAREQAARIIRARTSSRSYLMDTTGQFFDVPTVVEGRPESWARQYNTTRGERHTIRLVVDTNVSAGVPTADIEARMTAIAACVLTLQAQSTPVEVIALHQSMPAAEDGKADPASYCIAVHANEPGRPIDINRLVAMAHPSWLRRLMFRLEEQTTHDAVLARWHGSYGMPERLTDACVRSVWGKNALHVPTDILGNSILATIEKLQALIKARTGRKGRDDGNA